MNSDLLRTFLEVARTRHFGHAAENLFLTQSAVSSRIKQLEDIMATPLFIRQRNNILLTHAGEKLLPHAENLLTSWQLAIQDVGVPTKRSMQLAIGGTSNLWDTFLRSILPELARNFEDLYIRSEINQPQHLIRSLLGGRLDMAAMLDAPNNVEFEVSQIGKIELIMVSNTRNATLEDVPQLGHVFVDWGTRCNLQQARLFDEPVAPILHTAQSHIALEFILNHQGAAYLPSVMVESYLLENKLVEVVGATKILQDVHLIVNLDNERSIALEPILRFLKNKNAIEQYNQ
ncbi:LysR family transcriptional regulator [Parashewanella curva]|nr:LysR family transcriptional regulator [Parashewanella curva]